MKLYGKNPVLERLKFNPRSIRRILVATGHPDAGYIRQKCQKWGIAFVPATLMQVQRLAQSHNAQGVVADVDDFAYADFFALLPAAFEKKQTLIFLDNLTDPQNLGSLIRSLGCLGDFMVIIPTHDSVGVTEAVLRVASGGDNYVAVARVSNLANAIGKAKDAGFWIIGAVAGDGEDLTQMRFQFPLGVVVGSEQKGIREIVLRRLDSKVTIPMAQPRMSLNVAQAATILSYEIIKQKKANAAQRRNY